ncbi:MAG: response regulator [Phycisphaerae bacterium]|jgi:hypothetical protein
MTGELILPAGILIVDDDDEMASVWADALRLFKVPIVCVHSGFEAVETCQQQPFAVVLLDIGLGKSINGMQTADLVTDMQCVPIIFVTGRYPDEVHRCMGQGAVDFLLKPLPLPILRAKVAVFLRLHALQEKLRRLRTIALEAGATLPAGLWD